MPRNATDSDIGSSAPARHPSDSDSCPSVPALYGGAPSRTSLYSDPTSDGSSSLDPTRLSAWSYPVPATRPTSASKPRASQGEVSKVQSWLESNCMTAGDFALFASDWATPTVPSRAVSACPDDFMPPDDPFAAHHAPQQGYSNARKRSQDSMSMGAERDLDGASSAISTSIARRSINAMRPKSPRVDAEPSTTRNHASRARSTSDMLAVPQHWSATRWLDADLTQDPEEDDDMASAALGVADAPAAATQAAFSAHVRSLNPRLDAVMVSRVAAEQGKRHARLLAQQRAHDAAVARRACPSGARCGVLGAGPDYSLDAFGRGADDGLPALFHVLHPGETARAHEGEASIPATFPEGIPIPPVARLPAEFECPLCFQVKRFLKPSDWTKHVHEDVQPFTCTFPGCAEPKSFKRKADWVRHESERHRHLESWRCDVPECWHVCYRKDNFVQHLVREHRLPESRTKGKAGKGAAANQETDIVARLVVKCRSESTRQAAEEPCRFCGAVCSSWKKLTVHLAKHMEQVSMPVLELIGHQLPRFENVPIRARRPPTVHPQPYSWSMPQPSRGPAISVTNTYGTTDLEHAPSSPSLLFATAREGRALSATPSQFPVEHTDPAAQWCDGGPGGGGSGSGMLTASSSPYASVRSSTMPATPYSAAQDSFDLPDDMFVGGGADADKYPHPAWRGERLTQLETAGGLWHDALPLSPGMTADGSVLESAGAFSTPRNLFDFDAGFDVDLAADLQGFGAQDFSSVDVADVPQPPQQQWIERGGDDGTAKRADGRSSGSGSGPHGYGHL